MKFHVSKILIETSFKKVSSTMEYHYPRLFVHGNANETLSANI